METEDANTINSTISDWQRIISSVSAGLVVGILIIFLEISFAALIYSGPLDQFLYTGIGVLLLGTLILVIYVTLTSTLAMVSTLPQDAPAVIISAMAASIAASMDGSTAQQVLGTVLAAIILSSLITGLVFWLLGRFNLGRLVRYIPYPVVGGFLAGTGWLLVSGGIDIMTGGSITVALFSPAILLRWLPGVLLALIMFIIARRANHFLLLPTMILGGVAVFYLAWLLNGGTPASALQNGWLLGPFPEQTPIQPVFTLVWTQINWMVLLGQVVLMLTVMLVSTISFLMNISGLELSLNRNIDLTHELRSTGIGNILAGLGGAFPGYTSVSITTLANSLGAKSRIFGFTIAALIVIVLLVGTGLLSFFPKIVAGAIIVYIGILFLMEWLYEAYFKLSRLEYILIWAIMIIIAVFGFLEGVVSGLIIASMFFVINYSQTRVTRLAFSGANYQSHVMRPPFQQKILKDQGDKLAILELQGYIFFGSAHSFLQEIRMRIEQENLTFLLLDFRLVTGIDSSAILTFKRLIQLLRNNQVQLVVTNLNDQIRKRWERELLREEDSDVVNVFPALNQGIAACEQKIIERYLNGVDYHEPPTLMQQLEGYLLQRNNVEDEMEDIDVYEVVNDRVSPYIQRLEVEEKETVLRKGEELQGIFFVQSGQVLAKDVNREGQEVELRTMETGTLFGEISMYSHEGRVTADVVATKRSVLFKLTKQMLELMEKQDPDLAIAFHRVIARDLSEKLAQTSNSMMAIRS